VVYQENFERLRMQIPSIFPDEGRSSMIRQMLINLVSNAIEPTNRRAVRIDHGLAAGMSACLSRPSERFDFGEAEVILRDVLAPLKTSGG
jgi:signal transduction histidine kinase